MGFNATAYNTGATAIQGQATHMGLAADAAGTTATTHARQPITWGSPSGGAFGTATTGKFVGGAASGPVGAITLHTALTGGTALGFFPLSTATGNDTTSNAAGEFNVPSGSINPL